MKWSEFVKFVNEELKGNDPDIQFILLDYSPKEVAMVRPDSVCITIKNGKLGIE